MIVGNPIMIGGKPVLLWENASPYSSFAQQSIRVPKYRFYIVYYFSNMSESGGYVSYHSRSILRADSNNMNVLLTQLVHASHMAASVALYGREAYASGWSNSGNISINISDATQSGYTSKHNDYVIPQKIWGTNLID